jgi:hypothetical protein
MSKEKKCKLCENEIVEEYGKLAGTVVKKKVDDKNELVYVCSTCQKQKDWIEKAKE